MNKETILCTIFFFLSMTNIFAVECYEKNKLHKKDFTMQQQYSSYISSLLLSGCIGAITGSTIRYLEKQLNIESQPIALFLTLLAWALESEVRNDIIANVQNNLDAYQIYHRKGLMFKSAWIASWLAYLQMYQGKNILTSNKLLL
jgi:hypothetical protein